MSEWWLIAALVGFTIFAGVLLIYPLRRSGSLSVGLLLLLFICAGFGYSFWGSFLSWRDFVHQSHSKLLVEQMMHSIKNPQDLIDKLRAKLDNSPGSAKGWYLLGRLYLSQNENQNAVDAFLKAYQFEPLVERYAVNYAQALWELHQRRFDPQVRVVFRKLLLANPNQPDALAMLAMDAYMAGSYKDAVGYWQRLLKLVPGDSQEAGTIRKAIAKASVGLVPE